MSYNDYYPFEGGTYGKCPVDIFSERAGMRAGMPTRHESSDAYCYGFNSKENDNELKGTGNSVDRDERGRAKYWRQQEHQAGMTGDILLQNMPLIE